MDNENENGEATEDKGVVFTYIGDPNDDGSGPRNITIFGYDFTKDEPARVRGGTKDEQSIIRKLRGHNHFVAEGDEKPEFTKGGAVDELPALSLEDMKDVARAENVEFADDTTKPKLMRAIRAQRRRA